MRIRILWVMVAAGSLGGVPIADGATASSGRTQARVTIGIRIIAHPDAAAQRLLANPRGSSLYVRTLPRAGGGGECTFVKVARDTWRWKCPRR